MRRRCPLSSATTRPALARQSAPRALAALLVALHLPFAASALGAQSLPNQRRGDPVIPVAPATTPPGNDTTGYWQQRADYEITAQFG
jgi:hypothetical protein